MITPESIERVREAADIVQIVGEHVKLRRSGRSWRGPCPLHGGKNPNFSVSPDKGYYHCFTCGESGDVFTFLQKVSGVDFTTAVRIVAERSGIEVQETAGRAQAEEQRDAREPLWATNAAAAEWFTRNLWESQDAASARDYLAHRGFPREVADRFALGYAPARGEALTAHLHSLGYDDERLLEVGLLSRRDDKPETYARFRARLMIPIRDARANVVGFGGRLLRERDGAAKYLNTPETNLFSKRRLLYNLDSARNAIRKEDRVVVVEGYFDVIRLVAAGVEPVVAGLGTALTEDHAGIVARLSKNAFLLYDSDEAGQKATFRAGRELLRAGVAVRVATLPTGDDPDSFVARQGAGGLDALLGDAMDMFERQLQILERAGWFSELHRTRRAIDRLLPTVRATTDPLTRDLYLERLAATARVDKALLVREAAERPSMPDVTARSAGRELPPDLMDGREPEGPPPEWQGGQLPPEAGSPGFRPAFQRRFAKDRRKRFGRRGEDEWAASTAPLRARGDGALVAERDLTRVMLHSREQVELVAERFGPASFRGSAYRAIFAALVELGPDADAAQVAAAIEPAAAGELQRLLEEPDGAGDPTSTVERALARLRVRELVERNEVIDQQMATADDAGKDVLIGEKRRIMGEIAALGSIGYRKYGKSGR